MPLLCLGFHFLFLTGHLTIVPYRLLWEGGHSTHQLHKSFLHSIVEASVPPREFKLLSSEQELSFFSGLGEELGLGC